MTRLTDQLYAIIDAEAATRPLELTRRVLDAGCAVLQLRAKRLDDRAFLEIAQQLKTACDDAGVPFIVNDRADIAVVVEAHGLHLGQDDLSVSDARQIVGRIQIGVSTHNLAQAREAERDGADLIAFGPVFTTTTKENPDPIVGLEGLSEACRSVSRPVVGIGGITPENAGSVLQAGAVYFAAISALPRFLESAS